MLPRWDVIYDKLFTDFARWIKVVLGEAIPNLSVDKYRQLAIFIASAVKLNVNPASLTYQQWSGISNFIQNPREAGRILLPPEGYPEPKGRWTGQKGQKAQCDKAVDAVRAIVS